MGDSIFGVVQGVKDAQTQSTAERLELLEI